MVTYETYRSHNHQAYVQTKPLPRGDGGTARDLLHTFALLVLLACIIGFRVWLTTSH